MRHVWFRTGRREAGESGKLRSKQSKARWSREVTRVDEREDVRMDLGLKPSSTTTTTITKSFGETGLWLGAVQYGPSGWCIV